MENDSCLICHSNDIVKYQACFSEFISRRVFDGIQQKFDLCHCQYCGFAFYSYRFSDAEAERLYHHYRDDAYQRQRQACDDWYTKEINDLIGNNKKELESRHALLSGILKENIPNISVVQTVLDFGGDKGQFIPAVLNHAAKYVYDISGAPVNDGILKLNDIEAEKKMQRFDLILCAHVLEHVSDPNEVVSTLKSLMKAGQKLYLELPFDSPFYKKITNNIQYLFNPHYSLKNIFKKYMQMRTSKEFQMHEHINFFTKESVAALLEAYQFELCHCGYHSVRSEIGNSKVISALAIAR